MGALCNEYIMFQSQTSIQLGGQNTPGIRLSETIPENGEVVSYSTEDMQHHHAEGIKPPVVIYQQIGVTYPGTSHSFFIHNFSESGRNCGYTDGW